LAEERAQASKVNDANADLPEYIELPDELEGTLVEILDSKKPA
jgi:hypothetical protein